MKDSPPHAHVVVKNSNLVILRRHMHLVTQKYEQKFVPHVQHDYLCSFNQWYHCFVVLLWTSSSSILSSLLMSCERREHPFFNFRSKCPHHSQQFYCRATWSNRKKKIITVTANDIFRQRSGRSERLSWANFQWPKTTSNDQSWRMRGAWPPDDKRD